MHFLAISYGDLCRVEEALQLTEQVVQGRKSILGVENAKTVDSVHFLAGRYIGMSRGQEGVQLMNWVVDTYKRTLGEEH